MKQLINLNRSNWIKSIWIRWFQSNQRAFVSFTHKIAFNFRLIWFTSSNPVDFYGSKLLFSGRLNVMYPISWFEFHRLESFCLRNNKQLGEKMCISPNSQLNNRFLCLSLNAIVIIPYDSACVDMNCGANIPSDLNKCVPWMETVGFDDFFQWKIECFNRNKWIVVAWMGFFPAWSAKLSWAKKKTNEIPFNRKRYRITHRTSNVCKTSGSCRYDKAVRSFCPMRMAGLRSNGKSLSVRISMTRSSPASVRIFNCLSPSW